MIISSNSRVYICSVCYLTNLSLLDLVFSLPPPSRSVSALFYPQTSIYISSSFTLHVFSLLPNFLPFLPNIVQFPESNNLAIRLLSRRSSSRRHASLQRNLLQQRVILKITTTHLELAKCMWSSRHGKTKDAEDVFGEGENPWKDVQSWEKLWRNNLIEAESI